MTAKPTPDGSPAWPHPEAAFPAAYQAHRRQTPLKVRILFIIAAILLSLLVNLQLLRLYDSVHPQPVALPQCHGHLSSFANPFPQDRHYCHIMRRPEQTANPSA